MMNLNIVKDYSSKGFVVIKELVNPDEVKRYTEIAERYDPKNSTNVNVHYFADYFRFFDPRVYPSLFKWLNLKYFLDSYFLISRSKTKSWRSKVPSFSEKNFNSVSRIDSYISRKTEESITEWHTDQAFGGATHPAEFFGGTKGIVPTKNINKLFLHITDVRYKNGSFSYMPFSHKINLAIRELINKDIIKYKPFLLLQDAIKLVEIDHKNAFLQILKKEEIDFFVEKGKKALESDEEFVIECNAGDAILFNDFGYHKGTAPEESNRIIFRYFY